MVMVTAMDDVLRVACVQLEGGEDKAANLEVADRLVARAAATGAAVVLLPENWNLLGEPEVTWPGAERLDDGESVAAMRGWARTYGITLVGGSIAERVDGQEKPFNTSIVFDPQGEVTALY